MTVYLGCILIAEEFLEDILGLPDSPPGSIQNATWDPAKEAITLAWQDGVAHEVGWSSIERRIPGGPPTPVSAYVEPGIGVGLTFKGEAQGPFLKPRNNHDQSIFRHGVLTTAGYQRSGQM